jgi:hypothetical protein
VYVGRRPSPAGRTTTDGVAYRDERDLTSYSIFLRSQRTNMLEKTGRWDEAVAIAGTSDPGGPSPGIRRAC